jgi:hypothetical protein
MRPEEMMPAERQALERLIEHAQRDTARAGASPTFCSRGGIHRSAAATT